MALKLLVCDPSIEWSREARGFFEQAGYEVVVANNGKDAQLAMFNDRFFAVILNLQVENHSGFQVMKFIKLNHPTQQIVTTMENNELIDEGAITEEQLGKMGATNLYIKPLQMEDLAEALEGSQSFSDIMGRMPKREGASEEAEVDQNDEEFTKIKISEFYSGNAVLFDIYVRLRSNRYIKILHAGDSFSKERVDKYKNDKGVEFLYFRKKDRSKYIRFANHMAGKVVQAKKIPNEQKVTIMKNLTEKFLEEVGTVGMKPLIIEQGKEICENVFKMVESNNDFYKMLHKLNEIDPTAYTHSYLVCLYASMVIKQFEWQSKVIIETIAMGSILHDIGKAKLPEEVITIRPAEMTPEQLVEYQKHPELGGEILEGQNMISQSVKQIVRQHHEASDGTGFPGALRDSKILTLSKIVFLADEFVHFIIDQEIKPTDAIKSLLTDPNSVRRYNAVILEHFLKVFIDPGKIQKAHSLPSNSRVVNKKVS